MDGIGPRERRPRNINTHWGGVIETNHFGTHEFMDLCDQLGCDPYICGNVGSGSVREMQQWVEYLTSDGDDSMPELRRANGRREPWKVRFWGVGNENWGCGGNMRPEYYADLYRRYATYLRDFAGNRLYPIACGPNGSDYRWTEVLMRQAGKLEALSLHYYTRPAPGRPAHHGDRVRRGGLVRAAAARVADGRAHHPPLDHHGPLRPGQPRRAHRRRVGDVARAGTGHQPPLPVPAEHHARRAGGRADARHLQPPRRAGARRADRADRQRAAGDGADRGRPDGADAHLPRVRPVPGAPGRHLAAAGRANPTATGSGTSPFRPFPPLPPAMPPAACC